MESKECIGLYHDYFPFWDKISEDEKKLLCENTRYVKYKAGETIHSGGSECKGGVFVKSGCLRAYMLSDEGKEITLYRLYSGDICMLAASCVLHAITFDVCIDAEEDSELFMINPRTFAQLCENNVYVENFALNIAVTRFSDVMWAMQQILFMSFDRRLAIFLNDEIAKTGDDTIHLTHEQVAKYMGSAREVVSRMLKYFSTEGIVELSRGGIKVIDKKKLRELM